MRYAGVDAESDGNAMTIETIKPGDKVRIKETAFTAPFSTDLHRWHGETVEVVCEGEMPFTYWVRLPDENKIWVNAEEVELIESATHADQP